MFQVRKTPRRIYERTQLRKFQSPLHLCVTVSQIDHPQWKSVVECRNMQDYAEVRSVVDERTTRPAGYAMSQPKRKPSRVLRMDEDPLRCCATFVIAAF